MYNEGKMLKGIFEMQRILIAEYYERGMVAELCDPDRDIDKQDYQVYLKKLIAWITDELTEASTDAESIKNELLKHNPDYKGIVPLMHELMDTFSFIVELMIYSGIEADDIHAYYEELLKERDLLPILFSDGLSTSMAYGRHTNIWDDGARVPIYHSQKVDIPELEETFQVNLSPELYQLWELCMWDTVKAFSKAGRYLRLKEWKVEQEPTNVTEYKRQLMIGWLYFMKLLDMMGLEARLVYHFYEKINNKNIIRLANGY